MANIKSFPNNQDEYIGAEYVMKWLHGRTSGVFAAENNASVTAVQNEMAVNVSDGLGWMANAGKDGVVWWIDHEAVNGTKLKLSIDAADSALNRIDRIIVEWKTTNYVDYPEVKVLKGSLASNPTAPALTNNSTVRQISLARVNVAAGTTAITASMITDERLDASVCGLVTESISFDTSVMQNQFEALLATIQTELQNLNAGTAALLKTGDTMQGVLNMGGNKIQNVAIPVDDSDAANKAYADEKISTELLWENASSTSEFKSQTIQLDWGKYVGLVFEVVYSKTNNRLRYHFPIVGEGAVMFQTLLGADAENLNVRTRVADISNGSVFFYAAYRHRTDTSGYAEENGYLIPIKIYGIKGVIA